MFTVAVKVYVAVENDGIEPVNVSVIGFPPSYEYETGTVVSGTNPGL